jgi:CRP-like cAMP-binding protein
MHPAHLGPRHRLAQGELSIRRIGDARRWRLSHLRGGASAMPFLLSDVVLVCAIPKCFGPRHSRSRPATPCIAPRRVYAGGCCRAPIASTATKSPLTQELLAQMLGARRTTVTLLAQRMQAKGLIRYRRGRIVILDRKALEACACECYQVMHHEKTLASR